MYESTLPPWAAQLTDRRSGRVIFLSHCLLNEHTRYLGGACRACAVVEIVDACMERGFGIVQMPCPEEIAWGGVLKRQMLRLYDLALRGPRRRALASALVPVALAYTRFRYDRLARHFAAEIEDYLRSGYEVAGVIAVDGSPSCGLHTSIAARPFVEDIGRVGENTINTATENEALRRNAIPGPGVFTAALERALHRRGIEVPFLAHDLFAELDGRASTLDLAAGEGAAEAQGA